MQSQQSIQALRRARNRTSWNDYDQRKPSHSTRYGSGGVISRGRAGPVVVAAPVIQSALDTFYGPEDDVRSLWLKDPRRGHCALAAEPWPRKVRGGLP